MATNQVLLLRARAGLEQQELAKRAGVSCACVSRIESGESAGRGATRIRIADVLGRPVEEVFPPKS